MEDYTIDKVSWHTMTPGNTETKEQIYLRFFIILQFLQQNKLIVKNKIANQEDINEETAIMKSDLTQKGILLMKACYHNWLRYLDKGGKVENISRFEKSFYNYKQDN